MDYFLHCQVFGQSDFHLITLYVSDKTFNFLRITTELVGPEVQSAIIAAKCIKFQCVYFSTSAVLLENEGSCQGVHF